MKPSNTRGSTVLPPFLRDGALTTIDSNELPIPIEEIKRINPFMLNVNMLQRNTLKTTEKCRFIDEIMSSVTLCWKKNMTERMRAVDDIRMRTPTEIECSNLNIPNDRLNLHCAQSLLLLCGGCVGIRFTSEELQQLVSLSRSCETLYAQVDCLFKALPQLSKTRRIEVPYHNDHPVTSLIFSSSSSSSSGPPSVKSGVDNVGEEGCTTYSADHDDQKIIQLHCLIDSYFELVEQIQKVVMKKNESLPSEAERREKGMWFRNIIVEYFFRIKIIF